MPNTINIWPTCYNSPNLITLVYNRIFLRSENSKISTYIIYQNIKIEKSNLQNGRQLLQVETHEWHFRTFLGVGILLMTGLLLVAVGQLDDQRRRRRRLLGLLHFEALHHFWFEGLFFKGVFATTNMRQQIIYLLTLSFW